jgi:hypothetical protein
MTRTRKLIIMAFIALAFFGWWVIRELKSDYRAMSIETGIRPPW